MTSSGSTPLRVLHAPVAVGGHAPELARAERRLGLDSVCVVLEQPPARYEVDAVLAPPGTGRLRRELRRWRLLARALREFDVVHFNFGSSLTPRRYPRSVTRRRGAAAALWDVYAAALELRDLPLVKRAGKAVFVTYQGDDARQLGAIPQLGADYYDPALDRRKRAWIARFDKYADGIWALNPDLLDVLPPRAEFLPYASVDLEAWRPVERAPGKVPVVVHAPSDRVAKGTDRILDALEQLRAEGVAFELVLVENLPRDEARLLYERADLLVDQVLAGWYGGVAVELMALGKPAAAYLRPEHLERLPAAMREELPVIDLPRADVAGALRPWLTTRRAELAELGHRSRAYVERWHDPLRIAVRTKAAYERALGAQGERPSRNR